MTPPRRQLALQRLCEFRLPEKIRSAPSVVGEMGEVVRLAADHVRELQLDGADAEVDDRAARFDVLTVTGGDFEDARLAYDAAAGQIRALNLAGTGLKDRGVCRLMTGSILNKVRSLDLSRNRIRGVALNVPASSSLFLCLRRLVLCRCSVTAADLRDMLQEPPVHPELRELDLSDNPFGDAGARAPAALPGLQSRSGRAAFRASVRPPPSGPC